MNVYGLYENIDSEVRYFLRLNYPIGYDIWRRLLVDLQSTLEDVLPYDIRYGGIPSFYEAGEKSGEYFGELVFKHFNLENKSVKERAYYLDSLVKHIRMSEVKFSRQGKNIIKCNGGTMFATDYPKTGRYVCYHASGFIAGATSAITGRKFVVKEIKCVSAGDNDCEFLVEEKM